MTANIIAIANQKGGVGKTTTCANLGKAVFHIKALEIVEIHILINGTLNLFAGSRITSAETFSFERTEEVFYTLGSNSCTCVYCLATKRHSCRSLDFLNSATGGFVMPDTYTKLPTVLLFSHIQRHTVLHGRLSRNSAA